MILDLAIVSDETPRQLHHDQNCYAARLIDCTTTVSRFPVFDRFPSVLSDFYITQMFGTLAALPVFRVALVPEQAQARTCLDARRMASPKSFGDAFVFSHSTVMGFFVLCIESGHRKTAVFRYTRGIGPGTSLRVRTDAGFLRRVFPLKIGRTKLPSD